MTEKGRRTKDRQADLVGVYERLLGAYGQQHWWPGETPFEVMVGAVLTQNTAWTNVVRALANLKAAGAFSTQALRERPLEELAGLIRPSGYFNMKARKLRALGEYLGGYGDDLDALFRSKPLVELRQEVLGVYGVGPETADSILLYAGGLPSFVVDAYTVRVLERLRLLPGRGRYEEVREFFHSALPAEAGLFNEFHALFVAHGKDTCQKRVPRCSGCALLEICPAGGRSRSAGDGSPTSKRVPPRARRPRRSRERMESGGPATAAIAPSPAMRTTGAPGPGGLQPPPRIPRRRRSADSGGSERGR